MRFKIDWSSLKNGRKFTVLALFYFPSTSPPGGLYLESDLTEGFFALRVLGGLNLEGLTHGGAYFRNFTVVL